MEKFFITSSGTGVGKTFVTTTLCSQLIAAGKKVTALKPVISGYDVNDTQSDTALILKSCNLPLTDKNINSVSPWRFATPLSPNMAADMEGKTIEFAELVNFCKEQEKKQADFLLVEGVGGVCVPLNNQNTVLDLIKVLAGWKIILVVGSYLGSISHTITAIKALELQGLQPHVIIVSESQDSTVTLKDTINTLAKFVEKAVSIIPVSRHNKDDIEKPMPNIVEVCL